MQNRNNWFDRINQALTGRPPEPNQNTRRVTEESARGQRNTRRYNEMHQALARAEGASPRPLSDAEKARIRRRYGFE